MRRLPLLAWIFAVAVAIFLLYRVKYEVQSLRAQVAETERELVAEKEAYRVVAAEWAYLNRPERLQQLSSKYLSSSSVTVDRIAEIEAIPFPRPVQVVAKPTVLAPTPAKFQTDDGGDAE